MTTYLRDRLSAPGDGLEPLARTLESAGVPYLVIGSLASALLGRARWDGRVRLLTAGDAASSPLSEYAVQSLEGFVLDEEMQARSQLVNCGTAALRVAAAEDVVVLSIAETKDTGGTWHDMLAVLARADIDWEYMQTRGMPIAPKMLSFLIYADSCDLMVPRRSIRTLYREVRGAG